MERTIAALTERITHLAQRITDLAADHHETAQEFKNYRHGIRDELQRIIIDIDRINGDRQLRGKDIEKLELMADGLAARVVALERDRTAVGGGVKVIRWAWGGVAALLLIGADVLIRKYVG